MSRTNDGGPAFPGTISKPNEKGVYYPEHHQGMSLRDAAALAALQGFCAQCDDAGTWSWEPEGAVKEAWRVADAFIAAREDKP